ncbi:UNVERIFIED_CONTAM: hypothetical protein FKN15_011688 [Acipenser sinensis]
MQSQIRSNPFKTCPSVGESLQSSASTEKSDDQEIYLVGNVQFNAIQKKTPVNSSDGALTTPQRKLQKAQEFVLQRSAAALCQKADLRTPCSSEHKKKQTSA